MLILWIMEDIPAYTIFSIKQLYDLTTLCLNGTLLCVDFMDVIMGDRPIGLPAYIIFR